MIDLNILLGVVTSKYSLTPIDTSAYENLKVSGMKFDIKAFRAHGLGHVSIMSASGFFGLMKMDTLVINPFEIDLPLYSYDRILAMGNDTLITELYDTMVTKNSFEKLDDLIDKYENLPQRDPGKHWYDDIKLSQSISFKGNKTVTEAFDELTRLYLTYFLETPVKPVVDANAKKEKALFYIDGLLENGGPSTDVFVKGIGKERTAELFHNILFGM
ncbi:hypothetical protein [Butyrivibrio sp. JL13D10]|uniref:hypothetical protein n=1 Tax=Butyrivibrio sp. JL13D10 TaxID=3236815 RepID=UPI0038B6571C